MGIRSLRAVLVVSVLTLVLGACEVALPSRQPDAVGTVGDVGTSGGEVVLSFVPDPGYEYFQGTLFRVDSSVDVVDPEGAAIDADEIPLGATIEVWTEACAESFPVQCDVTAVHWTGPTG